MESIHQKKLDELAREKRSLGEVYIQVKDLTNSLVESMETLKSVYDYTPSEQVIQNAAARQETGPLNGDEDILDHDNNNISQMMNSLATMVTEIKEFSEHVAHNNQRNSMSGGEPGAQAASTEPESVKPSGELEAEQLSVPVKRTNSWWKKLWKTREEATENQQPLRNSHSQKFLQRITAERDELRKKLSRSMKYMDLIGLLVKESKEDSDN